MKPGGVILTYMLWSDWKQWWFNIPLFVGQLIFMIVGTAIGKIKWPEPRLAMRIYSGVGSILAFTVVISAALVQWKIMWIAGLIVLICHVANYYGIDWRKVWRAAQCSHVRLCLYKDQLEPLSSGIYINFGYEYAEIQRWRLDQCKGQFEYRDPTFEPSDEFMVAVNEYAHDQVGKPYDTLQLFSYGLNFIVWLFYWKKWGKEVFRWLNLRGGREVCSSGATACLRWAGGDSEVKSNWDYFITVLRYRTRFFKGYHTAMVSPCLIAIDENWEVT